MSVPSALLCSSSFSEADSYCIEDRSFLTLANYNFHVRSLVTSDYEGGLPFSYMYSAFGAEIILEVLSR